MSKDKQRLDNLKKKQAQIKAQIQSIEAAEKARERKRDTRRKILIGAYTLEQAKKAGSEDTLYQTMAAYLTRETDKALFVAERNGHE